MREIGEPSRPWRINRKWRLHCRQRRRLLNDLTQLGGFGALAIGKHAVWWRRVSGALGHARF
jgi:hypothetical protein